jgi:hypothetical protein
MPSPRNEVDLQRALLFLCRQWELLGYHAESFYHMLIPGGDSYKGALAAVQAGLQNSEADGFEFLKKRRKLALSVEQLVLRPTWVHLFTEADRLLAQQKLSGERGGGITQDSEQRNIVAPKLDTFPRPGGCKYFE